MKHVFDRSLRAGLLFALAGTVGLQQVQAQAGAPPVSAPAREAARPSAAVLAASPWFTQVQAELRLGEYGFQPVPREPGVWSAPNRAQALRSRVSASGLEVFPREASADRVGAAWTLRLRTSTFGRVGALLGLDAAEVTSDGLRVELDHGPLREWFENRAEGVEQGWTIASRPSGEGQVWIGLEHAGFELTIDAGARGGVLVGVDGAIELPYRDLLVVDASGRELPAWLDSSAVGSGIRIDDTDATYPLIVDPWLNGPDWTADSDQANAHYGFSIASAGDVNGDGYADVVVGAPDYDLGELNEGRVWVYHGSANGLGGSAWSADSNQTLSAYGFSVAGAGDVNGDGYDDVVVGAPLYDLGEVNEGRVWIYHGSPAGLSGSAWSADSDQEGAQYGYSVAGAGNVNGGSYDDVVVGAPYYDLGETDEGRVWVYHGSAAGLTGSTWTADSDQSFALYGYCVAGAGNVNGDAYDDVVIGAPHYDLGQANEGRAWLYHGSSSGLSGSDWSAESDQASAQYGAALAGAGDVDGDGYDDVIVAAPTWDDGQTDEGRVWVYHGSASGLSGSDWSAESNQADARYGTSVASAGDIDDDGYADVVVGAPYYDVTLAEEGRAWVYRGSASGLIDFAAWREEGKQVASQFGRAVAGAGDVNGDGFDDVAIGAPYFSNGQTGEGQVWLYTGCRRLGATYCTANPNSTGAAAAITAWCSASVAAGSFQLESEPVPNQPGIFFHAPNQAQNPFGNGFLCASGTIVRGSPVGASANRATYVYDNSTVKRSLAGYAGTTRHFQHWYRDPVGGGHGFNTSNAVSVVILP